METEHSAAAVAQWLVGFFRPQLAAAAGWWETLYGSPPPPPPPQAAPLVEPGVDAIEAAKNTNAGLEAASAALKRNEPLYHTTTSALADARFANFTVHLTALEDFERVFRVRARARLVEPVLSATQVLAAGCCVGVGVVESAVCAARVNTMRPTGRLRS